MKVIFFGNERLATGLTSVQPVLLRSLLSHGFEVAAVISRPHDKESSEIESLAHHAGVPFLSPRSKDELADMVRAHDADIGVLAAFGLIVPEEVIKAFRYGILNIHPSLLPLYRGPTPIESALLDGVHETGVSLMALAPEMDAGPVYIQRRTKIPEGISKADLADELHKSGAKLLVENLKDILEGSLPPVPQLDSQATYSRLIRKSDGVMDWQKPAATLEREVRAFLGWPGSRTTLFGQDVIITAASVAAAGDSADHHGAPGRIVHRDTGKLCVLAGEGSVLCIERLKPAGKKEMAAADFLRGLRV